MQEPPAPIDMLIAAAAGSISGLSLVQFEHMTRLRLALTLFVGFTSSIFVVPLLLHMQTWVKPSDPSYPSVLVGVGYLFSAGAHIFLPLIIRKATERFGRKATKEPSDDRL
jgi:hypothetical protein